MAIEVSKKEGETMSSLLRRFSREVQQSGIVFRIREGRFRKRLKNKTALWKSALRREERRKERERIQKLGLNKKKEN